MKQSVFIKKGFTVITLVLAILILLNIISRNVFTRIDLTKNNIYSLSESSRNVLSRIDDVMVVKVFFSENLPNEYSNNKRYLQDILEEYSAYSRGKIRFEFNSPDSDEELESGAQKYGIAPVQLQVIENDKMEIKRVFMGLAILYEDKKEILPVIQTTTGLEYDITTSIKKLIEKDKTPIGLVNINNQGIRNTSIRTFLNQRYSVRNIDIEQPVPLDINVLLMNGVSDSLQLSESFNLKEFVQRGGNLMIAQNGVSTNLQIQQAFEINSDIFDILKTFGFNLSKNLVLDQTCGSVNVMQNTGFIRMNVPMEYPFLPIVRNFNENEPTVSGLEQIFFAFPSEIVIDSVNNDNISVTPLMTSSDNSNIMSQPFNLHPDPRINPAFSLLKQKGKVLSARSEIKQSETNAISQVVLIGDSQFFADQGGGSSPENQLFILNMVDYLAGDIELINLRSREITSRPLNEISDKQRKTWKWINILVPSVLIVLYAVVRSRKQKKRTKILENLYD